MIYGTKRPVHRKTLELRALIHNRFDVEVLDAATGELKQKAVGYNVICNAMWNRIFGGTSGGNWTSQDYFNYVLFGSGSGTPAASDTTLFTKVGAIQMGNDDVSMSMDRRNGIVTAQGVATLNAESYIGSTLTEVGIGYTDTYIVTHALLQDMNGNPISITKTSTDVIKIYATIFIHWPDSGWNGGSINMAAWADNYYTFFRVLIGKFKYQFQPKGFNLMGVGTRAGAYSFLDRVLTPAASVANKTFTITTRFAAGELNMPIRSILIGSNEPVYGHTDPFIWITSGNWFSPPQITGEAVGTGTGAKTGFATAFPVKTGSKVYVDGVEASGATFRPGPADATHMERYFNQLNATAASRGALSASGAPLYTNQGTQISDDALYISSLASGNTLYAFENPFSAIGIAKFKGKGNTVSQQRTLTVQASDDCETWTTVGTITANSSAYVDLAVPAAYQKKKYWRFRNESNESISFYVRAEAAVADTASNIAFDTAPASGAVITADYTPDCIAKDANHVFDLNVVLTLGEYTEG